MSSLGKTRQIPYKAGNVEPHKKPVRQMSAPEAERFVFLLKEVLVKKGISQRELSRRLGIKIGTLTRYPKGDVNPYDVKLGIQRALTEELGVTMATLYSKLDGTEAPSEITVRDVSSWIKSNSTPEDMATLFQSQQAFQNWAGFGEFPNVSTLPTSEVGALKDQLYEMVASAKK